MVQNKNKIKIVDNLRKYKFENGGLFKNNNGNNGNICFDIETTGLTAEDKITVIEFVKGKEFVALLNVNNKNSDKKEEIREYMYEETDNSKFNKFIIACYDNEEELLENGFQTFIDDMDIRNQRLIAYNGKVWKGGFDIPFMKTRMIKNGTGNLFTNKDDLNVYYADLLPEIQNNFNTVMKTDEILSEEEKQDLKNPRKNKSFNDLDTAHKIFGEEDIIDNFDSSKEAVTEYENGNIEKVLLHCHKDVLRTQDLLNIVLEYSDCKPSDFKDTSYL